MARPATSSAVTAKHLTKEERAAKSEAENLLRGSADNIRPPKHLTASQKKIFKYIVKEMEKSGILGNLDIYVLTECSIAIDRMNSIESTLNAEPENIVNTQLMSAKEKYSKIFFRCCSELCLSPQSRAKMGNLNMQKAEENPLLAILGKRGEPK